MSEDIAKRKRGRPPKVKPQVKAEAIVQNIETIVVAKPDPTVIVRMTAIGSNRYLAGFGHGLAVPKPVRKERETTK